MEVGLGPLCRWRRGSGLAPRVAGKWANPQVLLGLLFGVEGAMEMDILPLPVSAVPDPSLFCLATVCHSLPVRNSGRKKDIQIS